MPRTVGLREADFSELSQSIVKKTEARSAQLHQNQNLEFAQITPAVPPPSITFRSWPPNVMIRSFPTTKHNDSLPVPTSWFQLAHYGAKTDQPTISAQANDGEASDPAERAWFAAWSKKLQTEAEFGEF